VPVDGVVIPGVALLWTLGLGLRGEVKGARSSALRSRFRK